MHVCVTLKRRNPFVRIRHTYMIPDIVVSKPERKKDHYLCRILTNTHKPIQIVLTGAQWMRVTETHDGNMLLRLFIPDDNETAHVIRSMDNDIFNIVAQNNNTWFRNALTTEQLNTFFHASIDRNHPSMGVICKTWAEPDVYVDGVMYEKNIKTLKIPKDAELKLVIQAQGIVFQKTRFGIRWILRKCWITTPSSQSMYDPNPFEDERDLIEHQWEDEVNCYCSRIDETIDSIRAKIDALERYKTHACETLRKAKECSDEAEWNNILRNLAKMILTDK